MAKSVIELNGQLYDSATGTLLGSQATKAVSKKPTPKAISSAPKQLDGFTRRPSMSPRITTKAVHQQPQKSKTLMRSGVTKPVAPAKVHAKTTGAAPKHKATHTDSLVAPVQPGRFIRATNTQRSTFISKFGAGAASIKTAVLPVATAPAEVTAQTTTPLAAPAIRTAKPVATANPFHAALEQASSHEQPQIKKAKLHHRVAKKLHVSPKVVSLASFTLVALTISGFVAYQNLPEIAMRVAATRAGFSASLPSYQPSGFSMAGPIKYQPGQVTVNYKSASDSRSFDVVQKNSSWNSETLLENFVTTTGKPYQTFQSNGRTIYIYDTNKATWVDGGVWYNIDGKSNLNSDQLLRIANGL